MNDPYYLPNAKEEWLRVKHPVMPQTSSKLVMDYYNPISEEKYFNQLGIGSWYDLPPLSKTKLGRDLTTYESFWVLFALGALGFLVYRNK